MHITLDTGFCREPVYSSNGVAMTDLDHSGVGEIVYKTVPFYCLKKLSNRSSYRSLLVCPWSDPVSQCPITIFRGQFSRGNECLNTGCNTYPMTDARGKSLKP